MSIFLSTINFAQNKPDKSVTHKSSIKSQAEKMGSLLLKNDFEGFIKYTYPKVVEKLGGKKKMIAIMQNGSRQMESEGSKFLNVTIGNPGKILTVGSELQSSLPQTIEMQVSGGKLITKSTLIAISSDKGVNWYFIDTSGKDIHQMRKLLPNLSTQLLIVKAEKPTFYKA